MALYLLHAHITESEYNWNPVPSTHVVLCTGSDLGPAICSSTGDYMYTTNTEHRSRRGSTYLRPPSLSNVTVCEPAASRPPRRVVTGQYFNASYFERSCCKPPFLDLQVDRGICVRYTMLISHSVAMLALLVALTERGGGDGR